MKINLAVHTATEGHKWQDGTSIPIKDLNEYGRIIKRMSGTGGGFPDPTLDVIPFGGAFILRNKVVFYRFHVAEKIDSKGRDALYLILGECGKEDVSKIDFNSLFAKEEMSTPNQPFPTELEYIGTGAVPCTVDFEKSFNTVYLRQEDLSSLGYILANCPNDDIQVKISGNQTNLSISVRYKATCISKVSPDVKSVYPIEKPVELNSGRSVEDVRPFSTLIPKDEKRCSVFLIMFIVAMFSLLIGGVCGYLIHGFLVKRFAEKTPSMDCVDTSHKKVDNEKYTVDSIEMRKKATELNNEVGSSHYPALKSRFVGGDDKRNILPSAEAPLDHDDKNRKARE